jgi:hypothetical protein
MRAGLRLISFRWYCCRRGARLYAFLGGGVRDERGIALAINGMPDHIHILAKLHQDKGISEVVRGLKSVSSAWIKKTFPAMDGFSWQGGYSAFTVGESRVEDVRRYIENQETHHRKRTFEEELTALLEAHRVEYDRRFLWT